MPLPHPNRLNGNAGESAIDATKRKLQRMSFFATRRQFLGILASALTWLHAPAMAQEDDRGKRKRGGKGGRRREDGAQYFLPAELAAFGALSLVLGRASDRSVTVSALAKEPMEGYFEYGTTSGSYSCETDQRLSSVDKPG